jgi:hypothetical protein
MGLFLYGEDTVDSVRDIRDAVRASLVSGQTVEWTNENTSTRKARGLNLDFLLKECNYFLRTFDPDVRRLNPIVTVSKPNLTGP